MKSILEMPVHEIRITKAEADWILEGYCDTFVPVPGEDYNIGDICMFVVTNDEFHYLHHNGAYVTKVEDGCITFKPVKYAGRRKNFPHDYGTADNYHYLGSVQAILQPKDSPAYVANDGTVYFAKLGDWLLIDGKMYLCGDGDWLDENYKAVERTVWAK